MAGAARVAVVAMLMCAGVGPASEPVGGTTRAAASSAGRIEFDAFSPGSLAVDGGTVEFGDGEVHLREGAGGVRWKVKFGAGLSGHGIVDLGDGTAVCFAYGRISDSGVDLVRARMKDGAVMWGARRAPLGVDHSKYHHVATVAKRDGQIAVKRRASFGAFEEVLALETGKQISRREDEESRLWPDDPALMRR